MIKDERLAQFLKANLTETALEKLREWGPKVLDFAQRMAQRKNNNNNNNNNNINNSCGLALITSGGTSVPLEVNAVRYLTNFSSGGRGANFVESLVQRGWVCVFLYHNNSIRPFRRVLDHLNTNELFNEFTASTHAPHITAAIEAYKEYNNNILYIPYETVVEYLYLLHLLTITLSHEAKFLNSWPMILICAAAVSDYYIPLDKMSKHKISGGDGLTLKLDNVPKLLDVISKEWHASLGNIPRYLITFKLETEEEEMKRKALKNLKEYNCDVVVANMLQNYKEKVLVYWKGEEKTPVLLERPKDGASIESAMTDIFLQRIEADMNCKTDKRN